MLGEILSRIRTPRDAAALFESLGYDRAQQAVDGGTIIARWRGFQVVACTSSGPAADARALAGRLHGHSLRALVVAVGETELAFAAPRIAAAGSTRVRRIPLHDTRNGALRFLESLRPAADNALAHALRIGELLNTESVTERFFVAFRQVLERMTAELGRQGSAADRRTAALLPLIRVLFLYFVQEKGWLDHRPDYLRRLLDTTLARRRHFHRVSLHPLFFGTLNRRPRDRSGVARLGAIPYLNGGLFEPHAVERRLGPVLFPNHLWRDAFDLVFERFRFCVREDDEAEAIAPDMLGRVFERVMDPSLRKNSGTFYTPEIVVRQMVDAALESALKPRLPRADVRALIRNTGARVSDPERTREVLRQLRILDPAVGSGAFLLGALERLCEMHVAVDPSLAQHRSDVRREILSHNLFGVDLDPLAVRLAELRLWLALITDDPTTDITAVAPLPNLDGVVRQGDALHDPVGAARAAGIPVGGHFGAGAPEVLRARQSLFTASGTTFRAATKELRAAELRAGRKILGDALALVQERLRDLAAAATSRDLFGRPRRLPADQRARYRLLLRHRRALRRSAAAVSDGRLPFFSFDIHAPDVMSAGGFSIVFGNPPWVRAERLDEATRADLPRRFSWWRASGARGFAHLPDHSVAFLQRALELTAEGGVLAMLVPAKLASAGYGETARRHLVAETQIEYLHRVSDRDASRFAAATYPFAVVVTRKAPARAHRIRLGFTHARTLRQRMLVAPGPWILVPDRARDAIEGLRAAGRPLRDVAQPLLGVKTGADHLFVGTPTGREGDMARLRLPAEEISVEWELLRPALRGRDIRPFRAVAQRALIWTHDRSGKPRPALPAAAAAHFRHHSARLTARSDYRGGPPWTLFRVHPENGAFRIVWADIARQPSAVVLEEAGLPRAIPLNTCYHACTARRETALIIAAVFNSTWCRVLAWYSADELRGGYRRINHRTAGTFPIPVPGPFADALTSISAAAHEHNHFDPDHLDQAVADALGLSAPIQRTLRELATGYG